MQHRLKVPVFYSRLILLLLLSSCIASAQARQHVRVAILPEPITSTGSIRVLITLDIDPDWYTYWKNPGDSGLPPEFLWELPEGYSVEAIKFPVPEKIVHEESVVFGYTTRCVLLTRIQLPDRMPVGVAPTVCRAKVDWLVCHDRCLREQVSVEFMIPGENVSLTRNFDTLWKNALSRLPLSFETVGLSLDAASIGGDELAKNLSLRFSGTEAGRITDFYPEQVENGIAELSSITVKNGEVSMRVSPEEARQEIPSVAGLLFVGTKAYECTFQLTDHHE